VTFKVVQQTQKKKGEEKSARARTPVAIDRAEATPTVLLPSVGHLLHCHNYKHNGAPPHSPAHQAERVEKKRQTRRSVRI